MHNVIYLVKKTQIAASRRDMNQSNSDACTGHRAWRPWRLNATNHLPVAVAPAPAALTPYHDHCPNIAPAHSRLPLIAFMQVSDPSIQAYQSQQSLSRVKTPQHRSESQAAAPDLGAPCMLATLSSQWPSVSYWYVQQAITVDLRGPRSCALLRAIPPVSALALADS